MKNTAVVNARGKEEAMMGINSAMALNFSMVYEQYAGLVYKKCLSMLREESAAEDITQEIFMKIFLKYSKFRMESKFSTWIFSITYNSCIDHIRKNKNRKNGPLEELYQLPTSEEEVPEQKIIETEMVQLQQVLGQLPRKDEEILMLKYQENYSIKEIALALKLSESAVKMRVKRAKTKARQLRMEMYSEN